MATSVIKRNCPLQEYDFMDMEGLDAASLLASLNANNSTIPNGASIVKLGSSGNAHKAIVIICKSSSTIGRGYVVSPYVVNGLTVTLSSGTWS